MWKTLPALVQISGRFGLSPSLAGWMMCRVSPLNDSVPTLALASSACLVDLTMTSVILASFLPASAETSRATGILGSVLATTATVAGPCGSESSSPMVTPSFALTSWLPFSSLAAMSSLSGFMAGSARRRPKSALLNASRSSATFLTLRKNKVESGSIFSGSAARPAAAEAARTASPRHPVIARRKAARNGVRINWSSLVLHPGPRRSGAGGPPSPRPSIGPGNLVAIGARAGHTPAGAGGQGAGAGRSAVEPGAHRDSPAGRPESAFGGTEARPGVGPARRRRGGSR